MTISSRAGDEAGGGGPGGKGVRRDTGYRRAVARSDAFALSWYGARAAGESLRARATAWLYQHPAHGRPGGTHPDPRQPSVFGWWSTLRVAASEMGLELVAVSDPRQLAEMERVVSGGGGGAPQGFRAIRWCWLVIYPDGSGLSVMHRPVPLRESQMYRVFCWELAMLLGDLTRHWGELTDPAYPEHYHVPSTARSHVACLHQFASALLLTEPECPAEWGCDCNRIRATLGAAPEAHVQATDALLLADLRAEVARQRAQVQVARPGSSGGNDGGSWELPSSGTWPDGRRRGDTPAG